MPGEKPSLPLSHFLDRTRGQCPPCADGPALAAARLDRIRSALARVELPGFRFRAGLVGGRPYIEPGRVVDPWPRDEIEPVVRWGPRKRFIPGELDEFELVREAFEAVRELADRELHQGFAFDGDPIFRKG
jgi:hypothetical protein